MTRLRFKIRLKTDRGRRTENKSKYKRYKNKLIANLRQSRKKYFSGLINMYSKNLNEIWKIIKTITYKNRQNISIPNLFQNAGETPIGENDYS